MDYFKNNIVCCEHPAVPGEGSGIAVSCEDSRRLSIFFISSLEFSSDEDSLSTTSNKVWYLNPRVVYHCFDTVILSHVEKIAKQR